MKRAWKILSMLLYISLGAIMFAAGTSPNSAVSNLSKWAAIFDIRLPNFLKGKAIDAWIFWILSFRYFDSIIEPPYCMFFYTERQKSSVLPHDSLIQRKV